MTAHTEGDPDTGTHKDVNKHTHAVPMFACKFKLEKDFQTVSVNFVL